MDMELIDGAACAASDLTARLHAELYRAQAQLAITTARMHVTMARGDDPSPDLRNDHILHGEHVAVLRQVLDGVPCIDNTTGGEGHAVSA
jgi:hypothetical protein